jgi:TPR repeat protein
MCRARQDVPDEEYPKRMWLLLERSPGRHTWRGQFNIALAFLNGTGVAKNETSAVDWMRKAAVSGHKGAQTELGVMLLFGKGVAKDEVEAVHWYRKAAQQGCSKGQFSLGVMLQHGSGVALDDTAAVGWYRKAAEHGHVGAQYNLGTMLEQGLGVPQVDDGEAVAWYRKAAKAGDADAVNHLKTYYDRLASRPPLQANGQCWLCAVRGDKLKKCSSCGVAMYCCRECQTAHWKRGHKHTCPTL